MKIIEKTHNIENNSNIWKFSYQSNIYILIKHYYINDLISINLYKQFSNATNIHTHTHMITGEEQKKIINELNKHYRSQKLKRIL